jgi:hypothetical protein
MEISQSVPLNYIIKCFDRYNLEVSNSDEYVLFRTFASDTEEYVLFRTFASDIKKSSIYPPESSWM